MEIHEKGDTGKDSHQPFLRWQKEENVIHGDRTYPVFGTLLGSSPLEVSP